MVPLPAGNCRKGDREQSPTPKTQDGLMPPHLDRIYLYPFYVNQFQKKEI